MDGDLKEGWYNDPTGRHDERWFIAGRMTSRVRDGSSETTDHVETGVGNEARGIVREGWYTDPLHRHAWRWFSGGEPTSLVRDGTVDGTDPIELSELGQAAFGPATHGPELAGPPDWFEASLPAHDGVFYWPGVPTVERSIYSYSRGPNRSVADRVRSWLTGRSQTRLSPRPRDRG